jgi:hypothetical protein
MAERGVRRPFRASWEGAFPRINRPYYGYVFL